MNEKAATSIWSKLGPVLAGVAGSTLYDQYAYEGLPKSKEDLPRQRVMNFLVNTPIVAGGAALAKRHPAIGIPLMLSPPAKDLALGSLPAIHHAPEYMENKVQQDALRNRILGAAALGALGLGAASLLKKRPSTTVNLPDEKGRIQVTLPTKAPGDAETVVSLPMGAINMSSAQQDKLTRDVRRRLREESKGRTKKRDPETGRLIPYSEYQLKYASSPEVRELQGLKKAMTSAKPPISSMSLPSLQTSALRMSQNEQEASVEQAQQQQAQQAQQQQAQMQNAQEQQKTQAEIEQARQRANIAEQQAAATKAQLEVEKSKTVPSASPALKAVSGRLGQKLKTIDSPGSWDSFKATTKGASRVSFLMKCASAAGPYDPAVGGPSWKKYQRQERVQKAMMQQMPGLTAENAAKLVHDPAAGKRFVNSYRAGSGSNFMQTRPTAAANMAAQAALQNQRMAWGAGDKIVTSAGMIVPRNQPPAAPKPAPTAPVPTATPVSPPTATPAPVSPATSVSPPTATPAPVPTATPVSPPTATPAPVSPATSVSPPTATPASKPTTATAATELRGGRPVVDLDKYKNNPMARYEMQKQLEQQYGGGGVVPQFVGGTREDRIRAGREYWARRQSGDYATRQRDTSRNVKDLNTYMATGTPQGQGKILTGIGRYMHPMMSSFAGAGQNISEGNILGGIGNFAAGTAKGTLTLAPFMAGGKVTSLLPRLKGSTNTIGRLAQSYDAVGGRKGKILRGAGAVGGAVAAEKAVKPIADVGTGGLKDVRREVLEDAKSYANRNVGAFNPQNRTGAFLTAQGYNRGGYMNPAGTFGSSYNTYAPVNYGSGLGNAVMPALTSYFRRIQPSYY